MISKGKTKLSEKNSEQYIPGQWLNSMKILENNYWFDFQMTLINKQIRFWNMFTNNMLNYVNSTNKLFNKWMELPTTNVIQENMNNIAKSMNLPMHSPALPIMSKMLLESPTDMDPMKTILDIMQSPLASTTKLTSTTKLKRKKKSNK
ncbi:hypothetical protein [Legionella tunisiensis]|uniref:hypothetical protein n=1 Tax=Legionella tunisiensis TaxID=1034944 RepID=UPI0002E0995A|nr:hypothetical protein [Legionella tunisiensis]